MGGRGRRRPGRPDARELVAQRHLLGIGPIGLPGDGANHVLRRGQPACQC